MAASLKVTRTTDHVDVVWRPDCDIPVEEGDSSLEELVYDKLVPSLLKEDVVLGREGNLNCPQRTQKDRDEVLAKLEKHKEFDLRSIHKALVEVPSRLKFKCKKFALRSYGLKHMIERCRVNGHAHGYLSNGDAMVVMLLLGVPMRVFLAKNKHDTHVVNTVFRAEWTDKSDDIMQSSHNPWKNDTFNAKMSTLPLEDE